MEQVKFKREKVGIIPATKAATTVFVPALVLENSGLAVHRYYHRVVDESTGSQPKYRPSAWIVTHVKSGKRCSTVAGKGIFKTQKQAKEVCFLMMALCDWNLPEDELIERYGGSFLKERIQAIVEHGANWRLVMVQQRLKTNGVQV